MKRYMSLLVISVLLVSPCLSFGQDKAGEAEKGPGIFHRIIMYIPNRILDVIDIVRCRVRVGPGIAVGIRATEYVDLFAGTYVSFYAGLPGPRCRKMPKLPIGVESKTGAEVSVADVTTGFGVDPDYSDTEFGLGFQFFLVGADVGIDPWEIVDFAAGIFFLDPRKDDL